jgi:hypothetical protein
MKCLQIGAFESPVTRGFLIRFQARDLGRLSDDRRAQDVVLDLLVDHYHDRERRSGPGADRERDDPE